MASVVSFKQRNIPMLETLLTVRKMEREFYCKNLHYYKVLKVVLKSKKDMKVSGNRTDFNNLLHLKNLIDNKFFNFSFYLKINIHQGHRNLFFCSFLF